MKGRKSRPNEANIIDIQQTVKFRGQLFSGKGQEFKSGYVGEINIHLKKMDFKNTLVLLLLALVAFASAMVSTTSLRLWKKTMRKD